MLLRFRFENHRSIREEQELSFVAASISDHPEVVRRVDGFPEGVLPAAAIYGANASGKTNAIDAFWFMSSAVRSSHKDWSPDGPIPRVPFVMDDHWKRAPSRFVADFILDGVRHQYGFSLDSQAVLEEWLFVYPKGKKQTWFRRKPGRAMRFGGKMPGENRTIANLTRQNSLFLSAAAQNNHEALSPIYRWFSRDLSFFRGDRRVWAQETASLCKEKRFRIDVVRLLAVADLGITGVTITEEEISEKSKLFFEAVRAAAKSDGDADLGFPELEDRVQFLHRVEGATVPLKLEEESDGTQAYFALLGPIIEALDTGGVICIDELDRSLHPLLAMALIRLFHERSSNPRGAQLIFNTHDTYILNAGLLRRDQIWFTEKNTESSTVLYPLSDFKPRRQENLERGYLQGRYGAIPFINDEAFVHSFEDGNAEA